MPRYKITLEYIGDGYCGWQRQKDFLSLQQVVEDAIYEFSKEQVEVTASGRTDAGVNAYGQVAHFDLETEYEPRRLMHSINHFCRKHTIGVVDCEMVDADFHARFSATKRFYKYKIINRPAVNIINKGFALWVRYPLDIEAMRAAAQHLVGNHDFSSFRARECQANNPVKTIDSIEIIQDGDSIEIRLEALSFLHHMVRNIVGSLLMVGSGKWKADHMKNVLEARDRSCAGPTADACGLYFWKVEY